MHGAGRNDVGVLRDRGRTGWKDERFVVWFCDRRSWRTEGDVIGRERATLLATCVKQFV